MNLLSTSLQAAHLAGEDPEPDFAEDYEVDRSRVRVEFPAKLRGLFQPKRFKAMYGGRGGAKSWSVAMALLVMGSNRPLRILCAREIQKSMRDSVHRLLSDQIAALGLGGFYEVLDTEIRGANIDSEARSRVRLIECQFRMPVSVKVVTDGPFKGAFVEAWDQVLLDAIGRAGGSIVDRVAMRMHVAVFTEGHLLALGPMPMRHNSFSLTPIWCYRRGRDRMPYGVVRRVRDLQMDLNKRASKALFLLSTNQIFAEKGAFDDINEARDEVNQPDGVVIYRAGKKFEVHRDSEMAAGQVQMMTLDGQPFRSPRASATRTWAGAPMPSVAARSRPASCRARS